MKKAILCFPSVPGRQIQYPTGLYKIASYCRNEYEIIVLDQRIEQDIEKTIKKYINTFEDILCLGFSVMTGAQIEHAINLSEIFHSNIPIVWGGMHPTICPCQTIAHPLVDYVVRGEGEEPFLNLLHYLDGKNHGNQLFLDAINENYNYYYLEQFSETPYIDFETYKITEKYFVKRDGFERAFTIETSRGCPHFCSFCHNTITKKPYRTIGYEQIGPVLESLLSYRVDGIIFQEDNLFADRSRLQGILDLFCQHKSLGWKGNSRIDYFAKSVSDNAFMQNLVRSGCRVLQFGVESGSTRVLQAINKKIEPEEVLFVNRALANYPINLRYNFIVGFPEETQDEIYATLQLAEKVQKDNIRCEPPFINVYTPYPGTPLYEKALRAGFQPPATLEGWSNLTWQKSWLCNFPKQIIHLIEDKSLEAFNMSKYMKE